jgi:hypothetical protein
VTVLTETWLIFQRSMKQSLRNPFWVVIGIVQPFLYLALFGPLLIPIVQSTPGFPPGDAWQVLVPALLIQLGLFGGLFVGFAILTEFKAGVVERMQVTPVSRGRPVHRDRGRGHRRGRGARGRGAVLGGAGLPARERLSGRDRRYDPSTG